VAIGRRIVAEVAEQHLIFLRWIEMSSHRRARDDLWGLVGGQINCRKADYLLPPIPGQLELFAYRILTVRDGWGMMGAWIG
jgi:hypothetical protein